MKQAPLLVSGHDTAPISELAIAVRDALIQQGLETPLVPSALNPQQKYQRIKSLMTDVVATLGLDLSNDSLAETPHRIAKMYVHEIFSGLDYAHFPSISLIENTFGGREMVKVDSIALSSTCEHHFVTIDGMATVAYVPSKLVIGLSKINRIVRFFAQRPQVQERLTRQILVALQVLLDTDDVAVSIGATHHCVKSRGVMDTGSKTSTSALGGRFLEDTSLRNQFVAA